MNNTEVKKIVKDEINNFISNALDTEINKIIKSSNSKSRDELIKTIKNSIEAVYKVLWQKRDFWKTDIK